MSTVLVTGGSGFIGAHCLVQLLNAGHEVRTTVRSLKREGDVRDMVKEGGASGDRLSLFAADLLSDEGWKAAVADIGVTTTRCPNRVTSVRATRRRS